MIYNVNITVNFLLLKLTWCIILPMTYLHRIIGCRPKKRFYSNLAFNRPESLGIGIQPYSNEVFAGLGHCSFPIL